MNQFNDQHKKTMEDVEKRRKAWEDPKCQEIYHQILEFCGGESVVRPGMRGQIKQHAITCFLKGQEPDFKKFYYGVQIANMIYEKRKRDKEKRKTESMLVEFKEGDIAIWKGYQKVKIKRVEDNHCWITYKDDFGRNVTQKVRKEKLRKEQ
jgi:hypothetical protein